MARALRELPLIDAAFEQGEISYSKVRAMTRVATPENEKQLLNIARHGTAAHMERLVRVYRRCREQVDASPVETAIRREERFYCFAEADETGKDGDRHAKAVPETAGNVPAETSAAASEPSVSAETTAAVTGASVSAETPPLTPLRVRRATALVHIAEHYLATRGSGATALKSSDAYQVFVHVNANDAHPDNRINGAHTTYVDDRRCLAPHVARQLACDASRRTVLENERGADGELTFIDAQYQAIPPAIHPQFTDGIVV